MQYLPSSLDTCSIIITGTIQVIGPYIIVVDTHFHGVLTGTIVAAVVDISAIHSAGVHGQIFIGGEGPGPSYFLDGKGPRTVSSPGLIIPPTKQDHLGPIQYQ